MAKQLATIPLEEFSSDPMGVLERVIREQEAVVVEMEGGDRAVIRPVRSTRKRGRKITEADREAFRASAGGWHDVDSDRLLDDIYRSRSVPSRPPVDL
jgi:hypothetical protein